MAHTALQEGVAAHRDGRLDDAVAAYRAALAAEPSHAAAYNLGLILAERYQWAEALDALGLAERTRPGETANLLAAANALNRLHRPAEGERLLRIVLKRNPAPPVARERLA